MEADEQRNTRVFSSEHVSGRDLNGSSLVPMLVAGLILVTLGYVLAMAFV